jgi:anti-sigma regulatory factor (Ser/Thr protein kinase)
MGQFDQPWHRIPVRRRIRRQQAVAGPRTLTLSSNEPTLESTTVTSEGKAPPSAGPLDDPPGGRGGSVSSAPLAWPGQAGAFRHEALLYAGEDDFSARTVPFILGAVEAGEPILVVVSAAKIDRLRTALDGDAARVQFAEMAEVGANPARIIPAWRDFVTEHAAGGRRLRGIGEPIWQGRSPAELVECQRHESLLNVAFAGAPAWWLLCPYDTGTLDVTVVDEAHRSHPFVMRGQAHQDSADYRGLEAAAAPFDAPLSDPPGDPLEFAFGAEPLTGLRAFVSRYAAGVGLGTERSGKLVLAVHEVATNSLRHGGGQGSLRIWQEDGAVICEVRDRGQLSQPLAGRERPADDRDGGRGLWLANQLCDLVQLRTFPTGTVTRLHMRRADGR